MHWKKIYGHPYHVEQSGSMMVRFRLQGVEGVGVEERPHHLRDPHRPALRVGRHHHVVAAELQVVEALGQMGVPGGGRGG